MLITGMKQFHNEIQNCIKNIIHTTENIVIFRFMHSQIPLLFHQMKNMFYNVIRLLNWRIGHTLRKPMQHAGNEKSRLLVKQAKKVSCANMSQT